jgi:hypothetical protein
LQQQCIGMVWFDVEQPHIGWHSFSFMHVRLPGCKTWGCLRGC